MSNAKYQVRERKAGVKAKHLRRDKIVPGILYGGTYSESLMIEMDQNELIKLMRENSHSSLVPLVGLEKEINVIIKEVQTENFTGIPMHFDFQAMSKGEVMTISIPIKIIGEEELKGKDIYIQVGLTELHLKGSVEKMPDYIEADVSKLGINDRIVLSDLKIPEELEILEEKEAIICIAQPSGAGSAEEEAEEEKTTAPAAEAEAKKE
jgi:large subunit ribosomal protein L25